MAERPIVATDDRPHEHGGEDGWRESLTFAVSDPAFGLVVRASWDPAARTATADVAIGLEDRSLIVAAFRDDEIRARETNIGELQVEGTEQLARWQVRVATTALGFASEGDEPTMDASGVDEGVSVVGQGRKIELVLDVACHGEPDGSATRRTVVTEQRFAQVVSSGHFDQVCSATGTLRIGQRMLALDLVGVRSRTWGVREPDPADARLLVGFDLEHAAWHERLVLSDQTVARTGSIGLGSLPAELIVQADAMPQRLVLGGLAADTVRRIPTDGGSERFFVNARCGTDESIGYAELARVETSGVGPGTVSAKAKRAEDAIADR